MRHLCFVHVPKGICCYSQVQSSSRITKETEILELLSQLGNERPIASLCLGVVLTDWHHHDFAFQNSFMVRLQNLILISLVPIPRKNLGGVNSMKSFPHAKPTKKLKRQFEFSLAWKIISRKFLNYYEGISCNYFVVIKISKFYAFHLEKSQFCIPEFFNRFISWIPTSRKQIRFLKS